MVATDLCTPELKEFDYAATGSSHAVFEFPECDDILNAKGYVFDAVDGLGWQDFGHAGLTTYDHTIRSLPQSYTDAIASAVNQPIPYDVIQLTSDSDCSLESVYQSRNGIFEAIWRSLTVDRSPFIERAAPEIFGLCFAFLCNSYFFLKSDIDWHIHL